MKEILLVSGETVLVDDEDYEKLNQYKWYIAKKGYVIRNNRIILKIEPFVCKEKL